MEMKRTNLIAAKRRQHSTMVFGLEQVFALKFDSVSLKHLNVLLLEGHCSMVLLLILNVFADTINLRATSMNLP